MCEVWREGGDCVDGWASILYGSGLPACLPACLKVLRRARESRTRSDVETVGRVLRVA